MLPRLRFPVWVGVLCVFFGLACNPISSISALTSKPTETSVPTSTPNLDATATAQAEATRTAQVEATATVQAAAAATTQAQSTAAAQFKATAYAQFTATAQAIVTARAQEDVGAEATAQALIIYVDGLAASAKKVYGPSEGVITVPQVNLQMGTFSSHVYLRNFVAQVQFFNPNSPHVWNYGIAFRSDGPGSDYRFYIDSVGNWTVTLGNGAENPDTTRVVQKTVDSGRASNFDKTSNGSNLIRIVCQEKSAYLYINNQFVTTLDVSDHIVHGDIWIGTSMSADADVPGLSTHYQDFVVSALPPP